MCKRVDATIAHRRETDIGGQHQPHPVEPRPVTSQRCSSHLQDMFCTITTYSEMRIERSKSSLDLLKHIKVRLRYAKLSPGQCRFTCATPALAMIKGTVDLDSRPRISSHEYRPLSLNASKQNISADLVV